MIPVMNIELKREFEILYVNFFLGGPVLVVGLGILQTSCTSWSLIFDDWRSKMMFSVMNGIGT